jgi:hypothetical protein
LFDKITALFQEINEELAYTGMKLCINTEYAPEYIREAAENRYGLLYSALSGTISINITTNR